MDTTSALIFAFTIIFSPFSALIAYIITYDEYQHHLESKKAKMSALRLALITFFVFIAAGLTAGFVMKRIAGQN